MERFPSALAPIGKLKPPDVVCFPNRFGIGSLLTFFVEPSVLGVPSWNVSRLEPSLESIVALETVVALHGKTLPRSGATLQLLEGFPRSSGRMESMVAPTSKAWVSGCIFI